MKVFPDFEKRANKDSGNILLTYGVGEDEEADKRGFAFLGVCKDDRGNEVHVFQMQPLPPKPE